MEVADCQIRCACYFTCISCAQRPPVWETQYGVMCAPCVGNGQAGDSEEVERTVTDHVCNPDTEI